MTETCGLLIKNEYIEYYGHAQFIAEYVIKMEYDLGISNRNYVAVSKSDIESYFFT